MKRFEKVFALVLAVVFAIGLLAGCATPTATEAAPVTTEAAAAATSVPPTAVPPTAVPPTAAPTAINKIGGNLVYISTEEPDTLDIQTSVMSIADGITSLMMDTLVAKDVNGQYVPSTAESWTISPDGLTWTFKIRQDVKFHNGDPMTANDWAWTFNRALDPNFAAPGTAPSLASVASVVATDDTTLVITLKQANYYFLDSLSINGYMGVYDKLAVEAAGAKYGLSEVGMVGTGPYKFKQWVQDESITIERNPDYNWGPVQFEGCSTGPYNIETITFRVVPDIATVTAAMIAGEVSYSSIQPQDVQTITDTGLYNILSGPVPGYLYLLINASKAPTDNVHFRRALAYAVNRDEVLQVVGLNQGVKILGPLSPVMIGYDPIQETYGLDYNPDKAKEEFGLAGYTYGSDGMLIGPDGQPFEIDFFTTSDEQGSKSAQVVQAQFAAVGLKANIQQLEWGTLAAQMTAGDFSISYMGVGYPSADLLYLTYHSPGAALWTFANDPDMDALLEKIRSETDATAQQAAVNAAAKYIVENGYMVPWYSPNSFSALDKNITDYEFSPILGVLFQNAYFTNLP
jgi:peptide/nickel transport system substrate-binding protein